MDKHQVKQIFDDIEVPKKELKKAIHQAVVRAENESNTRRRFKWVRTITNGMAIAAVVCILYLSSGLFLPSVNKAMGSIPIVGQIYKDFQDKVGLSLFKSNLVTALNEKAESRGITVSVNSSYYDAGQLVYNFTVDNFQSDEKEIMYDVDETSYNDNFSINYDSLMLKKLNNKQYAGQLRIYTNGTEIKNGETVPFVITHINEIQGNWRFKLPITKKNAGYLESSKVISAYHNRYQFSNIQVENGKLGSVLQFTIDYQGIAKHDTVEINKVKDDLGNTYEMTSSNIELGERKKVNERTVRAKGQTQLESPINPKAKKLTLIANIKSQAEGSEIVSLNAEMPFHVSETNHQNIGIEINNINQKGRKVMVHYRFTGIDTSSMNENDLVNIGETIGLGDTKKMQSLPDPVGEYEEGYYLKANIARVKNMNTAEMVSTFELDDDYNDKLSLKHFEFNEYSLYIDNGVLNHLIQLEPFSFTVPVHQVSQHAKLK
ncbi:DUF4179 domain-containing protein [Bacillus inaquosorum]|uniref:DUF4179 domain-containing protein n=1 Tax=Bacillus inaquosorum TaxID=483913 RepID=UPI00227DF94F|nr:DUF4179 domain-containing protein [Bacillus inaquosorum]MCY7902718.1 DUF4179 domain-containing protein [Bacillus inaquosorum]MCY8056268.1 DUF4179 domain-containing protein [Bacillus inaquosorum]MCY8264581.1 DUF4179 domain-containing protein [Bacillus inaquosorum]MCY8284678.1 DUF4179 domain-containing protein [Bacillus inaquosorum]MCY9409457.1 DUF4179 domain-containing protein [Bacillus inaquosorum]